MLKIAALMCGILFTAVSGANGISFADLVSTIKRLKSAKRRVRSDEPTVPQNLRLRDDNSGSNEVDSRLDSYEANVEKILQNGGHVSRLKFGKTNPIVHSDDSENYQRTAKNIGYEVQSRFRTHSMNGFDIPYVAVYDDVGVSGGSLYVTLTICGDGSWKALVQNLHKRYPQKNFVVYTGRHGDLPNQVRDGETLHVFDSNHTKEDEKCMAGCLNDDWKKDGKGTLIKDAGTITVIDSGKINGENTQVNHLTELRAAYQRDISEGKIVILAWCYSLFTFLEVDARKCPKQSKNYRKVTKREIKRTVKDLVRFYFHRDDPSDFLTKASTPSGSTTPTSTSNTDEKWDHDDTDPSTQSDTPSTRR